MANVGRMSSLFQSTTHLQWQSSRPPCYRWLFHQSMLPHGKITRSYQVYKQVYWNVWTIFKVNLSKISVSSKKSGHKILIHTTNDIPLPHHPSTLGQVIHPTLALSSPTWDPGERPYDHGSSWPHPLPSKHKDDEIWDEFQDISLSHLDSCWCAVECSPNVQVSLSQPTLAW